VDVFVDDILNPFMGAGALGQAIDEFNSDLFDHGPHGFVGGGYIALWTTGGRPILQNHVPKDTPTWGAQFKRALAENYLKSASIATHGSVMSYRDAYLDLDPTYRDVYGNPLMRLTFDFHDNEHKMSNFLTDRATDIAKHMKTRSYHAKPRDGHYSIVPYQTTHNTGGAIMGTDPKTSVVNRYLQTWDVPNVFVMGACAFPQNTGYNPTGTVGALTFWAAEAIRDRYLKAPGPLVPA
jgi:gluconate 2-dehydrogenase alpha chain